MTASAIQFTNVSKRFASTRVLDALSFEVPAGALCALIGVNGAGKTTSLKALLDFIDVNDGVIEVFGESPARATARRRLAFLPERFLPPHYLTGDGYLRAMAGLLQHRFESASVARLCAALDFTPAALSRPVRTFSKGMSQKLGLMAMLACDKELLVLDEPLSGLDPKARILVKRELERAHVEGRTIFYSSHMLADVQALDGNMVLLHEGQAVFSGTVLECCERFGTDDLERAFLLAVAPA